MSVKIIGKGERILMYGFAGTIDLIQFILDLFVVSEIVNHVIDIIVGFIILAYGLVRGIFTTNKILVLLAYFCAEQIPFVNALPFWTLDIRNIYSGIPSNQEQLDVMAPQDNQNGPLNAIKGIRQPRKPSLLNKISGIRAPGGGLRPPILKK